MPIQANPETFQFKFIFEDSTTSIQEAKNYRDSVILALSNRIRSKKDTKLMGSWSKNPAGQWEKVRQDNVVIALG